MIRPKLARARRILDMQQTKQESRIDWPTGFDRTPAAEQTRNNRFKKSLRQSIDDLADEFERVGVDDWRLSTGAEHQKENPRYPYADASPDDPGAVARWRMDGEQYAVACDRYSGLRDNIRTLYLYIREKRKMENRPVATGESEFANARLPPGDDDRGMVVARPPADEKEPHEVLGVAPEAPEGVIKAAARELKKENHPDNGGDTTAFKRVVSAETELLE
ncbi:J domain-containing protein [Halorussus sp. GCM10023401]|uniref:J domain-containing protein n=1 Tax=Halorussus sp. GCM10023401 TaxID=3252680 RepID=UPI0036D30892